MVVKFFTSSLEFLKKFLGGVQFSFFKKNLLRGLISILKKIYCGSVFILKKNLLWFSFHSKKKFLVGGVHGQRTVQNPPITPPHRPGTLCYNISF